MKNKFQILLSAIIYGFIPALSVNLINNGMSPVIVSFYRYFLGIPFLLFLWNKSKNNTLLSLSEFIKSVFFCVIPAAVTMLFLNISYKYISPGTATSIHFLYPLFVICLNCVDKRMYPNKYICISIFIAILGVLGFIDDIGDSVKGILLAFSSSLTYAIYLYSLEKLNLDHTKMLCLSIVDTVGSSLLYGGLVLFMGNSFIINNNSMITLVLIAILSTCALIFLQNGTRSVGAQTSAMLSLFEPITSLFVDIIIFGIALTLRKSISVFFLIGSLIMFSFSNKKR